MLRSRVSNGTGGRGTPSRIAAARRRVVSTPVTRPATAATPTTTATTRHSSSLGYRPTRNSVRLVRMISHRPVTTTNRTAR
jgi:hypothetical protein